jgi:AraC-like DNA-binding protein
MLARDGCGSSLARADDNAWTQRVGILTGLPQLIEQLGGDPMAVVRGTGLDPAVLSDANNRIPYAACVDLLGRAAAATSCAHLGLLLGRISHLQELGILGDLVRHSATVERALEALVVHHHLNSGGGLVFMLKRGNFVDLGYAIYHPAAAGGATQMYDVAMSTAMNVMVELCGRTWKPYEVFLPHARLRDSAQYRAFFKVTPRFNSEFCALRFPAKDLALPVEGTDPAAYRRAEQRVRSAGAPDLMQQVYRGLRRLMLDNRHSGDELAQLLSMHRRTLNRRLKARGTTFQRVLDDVRFEVACDLLANSSAHLDDIAATLGYAAVTPFMRTFRRWSGTTPGHWRSNARVSGS